MCLATGPDVYLGTLDPYLAVLASWSPAFQRLKGSQAGLWPEGGVGYTQRWLNGTRAWISFLSLFNTTTKV